MKLALKLAIVGLAAALIAAAFTSCAGFQVTATTTVGHSTKSHVTTTLKARVISLPSK